MAGGTVLDSHVLNVYLGASTPCPSPLTLTRKAGLRGGVQAEATVRSAQEQSGASVLNAESSRFAAWQMHKRDVRAKSVRVAL